MEEYGFDENNYIDDSEEEIYLKVKEMNVNDAKKGSENEHELDIDQIEKLARTGKRKVLGKHSCYN